MKMDVQIELEGILLNRPYWPKDVYPVREAATKVYDHISGLRSPVLPDSHEVNRRLACLGFKIDRDTKVVNNPSGNDSARSLTVTRVTTPGPVVRFLGAFLDLQTGWFSFYPVRSQRFTGFFNLYDMVTIITGRTPKPETVMAYMELYKLRKIPLKAFFASFAQERKEGLGLKLVQDKLAGTMDLTTYKIIDTFAFFFTSLRFPLRNFVSERNGGQYAEKPIVLRGLEDLDKTTEMRSNILYKIGRAISHYLEDPALYEEVLYAYSNIGYVPTHGDFSGVLEACGVVDLASSMGCQRKFFAYMASKNIEDLKAALRMVKLEAFGDPNLTKVVTEGMLNNSQFEHHFNLAFGVPDIVYDEKVFDSLAKFTDVMTSEYVHVVEGA
jgi:hypothetical protein